jgi:hypothetical protein
VQQIEEGEAKRVRREKEREEIVIDMRYAMR